MPPLHDVIATLPLPTVAIDADERIIALNTAARGLLGDGAQGRHFITALRQPALVDAVESTLADGTGRMAPFVMDKPGESTSYEVHVDRIAGHGAVLLSFQDITQVERASQMRRDFVANVSHELRTPLTALMGFIETLRGPARDDAAARERFLGVMTGEAERMNRLVGDLLSLSRVEQDERHRPTETIDLTVILETTLRNLAPLAQDNDVTLRADLADGPLLVLGDSDQLVQVFTNLLENAIKYGGDGQLVEITAETHLRDPALRGPSVRISVRDHGPGIDPLHLPRLTERFYRADSHRSRTLGGTGLGLAIVKHIMNRHRGRLKITSTPGAGATFSAILPRDVAAD